MLEDEVRWAARTSIHPFKMGAAAVVAIGVGIGLGPTTPGPVLGSGWRLAVSVVLGFVTLSVAHTMLQRRSEPRRGEDDGVQALRVVVATVAFLLATTIVLAYLLAAITGSDQSVVAEGSRSHFRSTCPWLWERRCSSPE